MTRKRIAIRTPLDIVRDVMVEAEFPMTLREIARKAQMNPQTARDNLVRMNGTGPVVWTTIRRAAVLMPTGQRAFVYWWTHNKWSDAFHDILEYGMPGWMPADEWADALDAYYEETRDEESIMY